MTDDKNEKDKKTNDPEVVREAHKQADKDISRDPDFQPDEDADLDEGELARKEGHP